MKTTDKKRRIDSQNVTLINSEILDCCEPLTIPVFQCENGDVACSDCCSKNVEECPFCHKKIGDIRCRAIEAVLESLRGACQNSKPSTSITIYSSFTINLKQEDEFLVLREKRAGLLFVLGSTTTRLDQGGGRGRAFIRTGYEN
ncbi:unnamed protein product [Citrullus colocynthis]|uniref:E3 ubiquitin-protein ligase Sina-like RING finger domain-containing protein n=1 Tax=Citrullus colocynthis TaxID=252529 RepID=A0ABP0YC67_9ROSI